MGHRLTRHQSGPAGRFVQRQPRGEPGRQGRRVRAACTVSGGDLMTSDRDGRVPRSIEEMVNRVGPVPPGDEGRRRAHLNQALGQFGTVIGHGPGERLCFGQVGGHHGGQREEPLDQGSDRVREQQRAS